MKFVLETLNLVDEGEFTINPNLKKYIGKTLLKISDFEQMPVGVFDYKKFDFHPGNSKDPKAKWHNIDAAIEKIETNVLHIKKDKLGYIYPFFTSQPVNLYNCRLKYSFRIKGNGKISPGLWPKRKFSSWNYKHGTPVQLTKKWQKVSYTITCIDPSVTAAACSISIGSKTADFYVDDIKLEIIE